MKSCVSVKIKEVKSGNIIKRIITEENDWNHVEGNAVEVPVDSVSRDRMVQA